MKTWHNFVLFVTLVLLGLTMGCTGDDFGATPDLSTDLAADMDTHTLTDSGIVDGEDPPVEMQTPDASPDLPTSGSIAFESYRNDGRPEIYLMDVDGTDIKRLTTKGGRTPRFSPDGRWIAYQLPSDNSTRLIRPDGSGDKHLHGGVPWFWHYDGSGLVVQDNWDFFTVNPEDGTATLFFRRSDFPKLENKILQPGGITADGRYLVAASDRYRDGFTGDNGSFKASFAAILLDMQDKTKLYFFGNGCAPRSAPGGDWVYHVRGDGDTNPDIYHMNVNDIATRSSYEPIIDLADADWGHTYFPKISNDNQWLVYGASTGCHDQSSCDYEIFIHRLSAPKNQRKRLTFDPANDRSPSLFVGDLP
ncbi:MAG: PD40 domain-containing protein [Deltaproteobacteria bacterium]|nr:PD40 domain-containing protein [Deltaproteobacteria bacterium]